MASKITFLSQTVYVVREYSVQQCAIWMWNYYYDCGRWKDLTEITERCFLAVFSSCPGLRVTWNMCAMSGQLSGFDLYFNCRNNTFSTTGALSVHHFTLSSNRFKTAFAENQTQSDYSKIPPRVIQSSVQHLLQLLYFIKGFYALKRRDGPSKWETGECPAPSVDKTDTLWYTVAANLLFLRFLLPRECVI